MARKPKYPYSAINRLRSISRGLNKQPLDFTFDWTADVQMKVRQIVIKPVNFDAQHHIICVATYLGVSSAWCSPKKPTAESVMLACLDAEKSARELAAKKALKLLGGP